MAKMPFGLTERKDSPYWYVRFKNEATGKYMSWRSTGEKSYGRAVRRAWELYAEEAGAIERKSFYETVRRSDYTAEDVRMFLDDFVRRGLLVSYVLPGEGAGAEDAVSWLCSFWDPARSLYLREKARKGQAVHRKHAENSAAFIRRHWAGIIGGRTLGEVSRSDVQAQFDRLDPLPLSGNTKNHILRALLTPMRWAFANELLPRDITRGWTMYRVTYRRRAILTRAMAEAVFMAPWGSHMAKVASMLAMCTGMRCGEIQALTEEDIGDGLIRVRRSWSVRDGLKCTKNGEERTVYVPFPSLIGELHKLADASPWGRGGFVFWGRIPSKPVDGKVFSKFFRRALVSSGLTAEEAAGYTFHAWRHFYATYMADRVDPRALQGQTGHKTRAMLEHYAAHRTAEEAVRINAAAEDAFGGLLPLPPV